MAAHPHFGVFRLLLAVEGGAEAPPDFNLVFIVQGVLQSSRHPRGDDGFLIVFGGPREPNCWSRSFLPERDDQMSKH